MSLNHSEIERLVALADWHASMADCSDGDEREFHHAATALLNAIREREPGEVWMVLIGDYDSCVHCGLFFDKGRAEEYADRLRECVRDGEVVVERWREHDMRLLRGAYVVEMDAGGGVVDEGWQSWARPDGQSWDGIRHAHFWTSDGERVTTEYGAVLRAVGWDRDEAVERGRALLQTVPMSDNP